MTVALMILSCDQSFNPKGEFEKTLAVYAVFSTAQDTVLIRVAHTYDPPGFDPFEVTQDPTVPDATVQVFKGDSAYSVKDTLFARNDTSRYSTNITAFAATGLTTEFGGSYSLTVSSATYGTFDAAMTLPTKGQIVLGNSYVLDLPNQFRRDTLFLAVHLSPVTRGYLLRAYLEYDVPQGNQTVAGRMEVPLYRTVDDGITFLTLLDPTLPALHRRVSSPAGPGIEPGDNDWFQVEAFRLTADAIHARVPSAAIRRAVFILNQVEPNFYNYYNVTNGFQDPRSIRIDEPSFSNIRGGEGVFGGFTVEELSYDLPFDQYN